MKKNRVILILSSILLFIGCASQKQIVEVCNHSCSGYQLWDSDWTQKINQNKVVEIRSFNVIDHNHFLFYIR